MPAFKKKGGKCVTARKKVNNSMYAVGCYFSKNNNFKNIFIYILNTSHLLAFTFSKFVLSASEIIKCIQKRVSANSSEVSYTI